MLPSGRGGFRIRSVAGAASGKLAAALPHAPTGRSYVSGRASPFSRQFTSGNMCGNPRAQLFGAFHWLP